MHEIWTIPTILHALVATLALVFGGFNAFRPTRGDLLHRTVGRIWVGLMEVTALSGIIVFLGVDPHKYGAIDIFLVALALWVVVTLVLGILTARKGNIGSHKRAMLGNYIGLVVALVFVLIIPTRDIPTSFRTHPTEMVTYTALLFGVALVALCLVYMLVRHRIIRGAKA